MDSESLVDDQIVVANEQDRSNHQWQSHGGVAAESLRSEMGGLIRCYDAMTVTGTGSWVGFTFRPRAVESSLILEIQEIHQRRPKAFGYTIEVNGTPVYFRTYEELGSGPNHYFIQIPAKDSLAKELRITLTSAGASAFSLGQIWLYRDFFNSVDAAEQVYRPMALMSQVVTAADSGPALKSFAPYGDFRDAHFAKEPYLHTQTMIRERLEHAYATGRPLQMLFNGPIWSGGFAGPDGEGGYFNDARYSLLTYDRNRSSFLPSYPNMWRSRFWSTYRDPRLLEVMRRRYVACLKDLQDAIDLLKARGKDPLVVIARELGPPLGEINGVTVAAAARDGIDLAPQRGLGFAERLWLYRDAVRLWQELATWTKEVIKRDSVVVDNGRTRLPSDQLLNNQYAHTLFSTEHPMLDRRWFAGQTGMVDGFWTSGELFWNRFQLYDYVRAHGKLASVNLTITVLKNDCTPLHDLYDAGAQFLTIYQDTAAFAPALRAADGCEHLPAVAPTHHEPQILHISHNIAATLGTPGQVIDQHQVRIHSQPLAVADVPSVSRLAAGQPGEPGWITWRLENGGDPFAYGLTLHLDGRIAPGAGNRLEVHLGETPESLQLIQVLTDKDLPCPDHWEPFMTSRCSIGLGTSLVGRHTGVLRLVFHATAAADANFLLETKVTHQWPATTGHHDGHPWTRHQQRTLNLWVQDRATASHVLGQYQQLAGEDPILIQGLNLFRQGRYRSCQRLISGAQSEVLPARYTVRGHGQLGRHEVTVGLPDPDAVVVITLECLDARGCRFQAFPEATRQTFTLSIPGQGRWTLHQERGQQFYLTPDPLGPLESRGGQITASVEVVRPSMPVRMLPRILVARYLGGNRTSIRIDTQDLEVMQFQNSITLTVAPTVEVQRSAERLISDNGSDPWPCLHDRVELHLDDRDRITAIRAVYGHDKGRIAHISPPSFMPPYSNGGIGLDNGQFYEFSYETALDTVAMHNRYCDYETRMLLQALRPGQFIEIDYSPYSEGGTTRRLIRVSQPYRVLLDQEYLSMPPGHWREAPVAIEEVFVGPHKAEPNYLHDVVMQLMRPTSHYQEGFVIYQISSDRPLGMTVAEFGARAYEDSSRVDFSVSTDDGATWITCGHFDNTWQNCYPQSMDNYAWKNPPQFIDLTEAVTGRNGFLLKMSLFVGPADERFCVSMLRVVSA
jgi:hypothetical protein